MKSNPLHLVTALLNLFAGCCFLFAAVCHTDITPKILSCISSGCLFISGIGFLLTYLLCKRRENQQKP